MEDIEKIKQKTAKWESENKVESMPVAMSVNANADVLAAGSYPALVTITDDDTGATEVSVFLTIAQEDAEPTYVGACFVSTDPKSPNDIFELELRAVVISVHEPFMKCDSCRLDSPAALNSDSE